MLEMNGWTFLAAQRTDAELVRIPVIVRFAGYNLQGGSERIAAADVLAKPFAIDHRLAKVGAETR
jgi:hypothetical protein